MKFGIVSYPSKPLVLFKKELNIEYDRVVHLEFKFKEDLATFKNK